MRFIIIWLVVCTVPLFTVFGANQSSKRLVTPACAVSGVPGVPGVPGRNGRDGAKGDQGSVGAPGKKGPNGSLGAPGKKGSKGSSGTKGHQGPLGPPGKMGAKGRQGDKGDQGPTAVVPQRNWKQCAWKALNDGRDSGLIKDCVFVKRADNTALKVEFDGDFRICCCVHCCKRWYFTFNGVECSSPVTIEAVDVIYNNHGRTDTNIHKHSQIGGYCEGIGHGTVRVGLMVGDCGHGFKSGSDAYAGYISTSRIVIEEVSPPQ